MTTDPNKEYVVSYLTLREMIGWCGLLMPIVVRLGAYIFEGIFTTHSISAYYYTGMRDVFVSTLVLIGALLACYRGPDLRDNVVATIAGLAAIGIGLCPTDPMHLVFTCIFFALSFYLVYFRFSAGTPPMRSLKKIARNKIYKACGTLMLISFIAIGLLALRNDGASIFWPETVAVISFAVAWLVKGRIVLKEGAA